MCCLICVNIDDKLACLGSILDSCKIWVWAVKCGVIVPNVTSVFFLTISHDVMFKVVLLAKTKLRVESGQILYAHYLHIVICSANLCSLPKSGIFPCLFKDS